MTHDPTRDCEHGRLKGKCDVCDLQAEIERLNRVNADLVDALINLRWAASERDKKNRIRQFDEFMDKADAAIAKAIGETK